MDTVTPGSSAEAGLSRTGLYRAARVGRLDRIARGLYRTADAPAADWDWLEAASRRPDATICLISALAYHDLIDTIPASLDVAIPRGARKPAGRGQIIWHLFDAATFGAGRSEIPVPGAALSIGLYSPERCIADAFRLRDTVGYETARDALREWLRRGGKPGGLLDLASRLPRARTPLLQTLDALV